MQLDHLRDMLDCMRSLGYHHQIQRGESAVLLVDCSYGRENEWHPGSDDEKTQQPERPPIDPEDENERR